MSSRKPNHDSRRLGMMVVNLIATLTTIRSTAILRAIYKARKAIDGAIANTGLILTALIASPMAAIDGVANMVSDLLDYHPNIGVALQGTEMTLQGPSVPFRGQSTSQTHRKALWTLEAPEGATEAQKEVSTPVQLPTEAPVEAPVEAPIHILIDPPGVLTETQVNVPAKFPTPYVGVPDTKKYRRKTNKKGPPTYVEAKRRAKSEVLYYFDQVNGYQPLTETLPVDVLPVDVLTTVQ